MDNKKITRYGIDTLKVYSDKYTLPNYDTLKNKGFSITYKNNEITKQEEITILKNIPYEKNNKKSSTYSLYTKNGYLFTSLSLPKYIRNTNDNTILASDYELDLFAKKIDNELKLYGIDIDIKGLKLSRIDITKNAIMSRKCREYIAILKNLNMKYIKENGKKFYCTTATFFNTNKEICIYDKLYEQEKKEGNILRNELRFKNKKTIKSIFNIDNFYELKNNFCDIIEKAKTYEEMQLFNIDITKKEDIYFNIKNIFDMIQAPKNIYQDFFYYYLFGKGLNKSEIINLIYTKLQNLYKQDTLYVLKNRYKKIIDNKYNNYMLMAKNQDNITYIDLYSELKNKLLA